MRVDYIVGWRSTSYGIVYPALHVASTQQLYSAAGEMGRDRLMRRDSGHDPRMGGVGTKGVKYKEFGTVSADYPPLYHTAR